MLGRLLIIPPALLLMACATDCRVTDVQTCTVKGNINRDGVKILHTVDSPNYCRVKLTKEGERCFDTKAEAEAAGFSEEQSP